MRRLWIFAVAAMVLAPSAIAQTICQGARLPVITAPGSSSPYLELELDGKRGPWLLDYGYTASMVSAQVWPAPAGQESNPPPVSLAGFTFPGWAGQTIRFGRKDWTYSVPPLGHQHGVIGVDLLNNQAVELHLEDPANQYAVVGAWGADCVHGDLTKLGYRRISQTGYFENATVVTLGVVNTPVVFIDIGKGSGRHLRTPMATYAQIDPGFDDIAYPHTVDVNVAFEAALLKREPGLKPIATSQVLDCENQLRYRRIYRLPAHHLRIEDEKGQLLQRIGSFHIEVKERESDTCRGIASIDTPAAQLGASFLRDFRTILFLPRAQAVWIRP